MIDLADSPIITLFKKGFIQPGTVVGVMIPNTSSHRKNSKICKKFVVQKMNDNYSILAKSLDDEAGKVYTLYPDIISEIDGMEVGRYLEGAADLDKTGNPINRGKKRGRKPKIRL